uniref:ABC transporter domain-containing protein n=1 Tax=Ditylum brightwellii TaxID=49249 RepID=A0A7S4WJU8_9STRA
MGFLEEIRNSTMIFLHGIEKQNLGGELQTDGLIDISQTQLIFSTLPLVFLAMLSWYVDLELTSPIIVGCIRTFVQLSILGLILNPIFGWGVTYWWVVIGYVFFMVVLASNEAASRSQYSFPGMNICVLAAMVVSVGIVAIFAFGMVVQANPPWDPQYVIPICGMLLGNCVSGVSVALDIALTNLVEQRREVELLLSFGASIYEASFRLMKDAVRSGTMPQLNSMAIIGLVSIPGMMTGQILGGAPVTAAARYQILIMYFIGFCAFSNIFAVVFIAIRAGFDTKTHSLQTDHFVKRGKKKKQCPTQLADCLAYPFSCCCPGKVENDYDKRFVNDPSVNKGELEPLNESNSSSTKIRLYTLHNPSSSDHPLPETNSLHAALEIRGVSRSVPLDKGNSRILRKSSSLVSTSSSSSSLVTPQRTKTLFNNLNVNIKEGEIVAVSGPSGAGKSQLLRIIAGLTPPDDQTELNTGGEVLLHGRTTRYNNKRKGNLFYDMTTWRQKVRYVTQYKVDIPGTPRDFMNQIAALHSWKQEHRHPVSGLGEEGENAHYLHSTPNLQQLENTTMKLLKDWGIESPSIALDAEWTSLSGGESQRVILALSLSSRPAVLLLDESTSGLDLTTKMKVEETILTYANLYGMIVLMSTHDEEQIERIMSREG